MKFSDPCLAGLLVVAMTVGGTGDGVPDSLSVVQALIDAERAGNLDAAVGLFADDAFIVNVTGRKTAGKEQLRWFINTEIWMREDFRLRNLQVAGDRVSWVEPATAAFYKNIGVAPVQFAFEATVLNGKIASIIAHLPASEIARVGAACTAQAKEPLLYGGPCSEFVQLVQAHTRRLVRR
jgi:ketosteroid isomerase-like protein